MLQNQRYSERQRTAVAVAMLDGIDRDGQLVKLTGPQAIAALAAGQLVDRAGPVPAPDPPMPVQTAYWCKSELGRVRAGLSRGEARSRWRAHVAAGQVETVRGQLRERLAATVDDWTGKLERTARSKAPQPGFGRELRDALAVARELDALLAQPDTPPPGSNGAKQGRHATQAQPETPTSGALARIAAAEANPNTNAPGNGDADGDARGDGNAEANATRAREGTQPQTQPQTHEREAAPSVARGVQLDAERR